MKKVILSIGAVLFIAAAGVNVHLGLVGQKKFSGLTLKNIVVWGQSEGGSGYSCSVSTNCINIAGTITGSVSCTGSVCSRTSTSVTCDNKTTKC